MDRHTRLNYIFSAMKKRCYSPNCKAYKSYGGRGITICDEWRNPEKVSIKGTKSNNVTKGFVAFKEWALNNGYADNLTIDRIDVNKGYSPENCRWATPKEQQNNLRNNVMITYKGHTKTLAQWCEELNVDYQLAHHRLQRNWSVEKTFETKANKGLPLITYKGKTQTVKQWSKELDIKYRTVYDRLSKKWTVEEAFGIKKRGVL